MVFDGTLTNFEGLTSEQKRRILDYPLQIYICDGTEEEQIAWFKVINIAGERLTEQEMRNAVYSGPWVTQAKRQKGICPMCGKHFELEEMEADHIKPWKDGGRTIAEDCQML